MILLDFVIPTDEFGNTTQDRKNVDLSIKRYWKIFDKIITINSGTVEEKRGRLQQELHDLCQLKPGDSVYLHFLGHGCCEEKSEGLQFVTYSELHSMLLPLKQQGIHVYINMLSSCNTSGMAQYMDCYDVLWYTDRSVTDTDTPFLRQVKYLAKGSTDFDFDTFRAFMGYPSYQESVSQ